MREINGLTEFNETIKEGMVLVDYSATWCSPCKMIAPILEEISKERKDVTIVKLDVDTNQKIAMNYGVQSIPMLMLFFNGEKQDSVTGALPKSVINKFLDKNIKKEEKQND
jgi:thioredoxin 1